MIPQAFLPPQLSPPTSTGFPFLILSLGLLLAATLFAIIQRLRACSRHTRQDLEMPASPPPDYKHSIASSPSLASAYIDLPPPLRTTLHSPLAGQPWTSADLAFHPWRRHCYNLLAPPQPPHQDGTPTTTHIYVTETHQVFALSPSPSPPPSSPSTRPSTSPATHQQQQPSMSTPPPPPQRRYRRRRTLVFEGISAAPHPSGYLLPSSPNLPGPATPALDGDQASGPSPAQQSGGVDKRDNENDDVSLAPAVTVIPEADM